MLNDRTLSIVNRYKQLKNLRLTSVEFNISHEAVRLHLLKYEKETNTIIWRMNGTKPTGEFWKCKICGKENGPAKPRIKFLSPQICTLVKIKNKLARIFSTM